MNRIYLFGKIISKSKLKYVLLPKLKMYIEITIETIYGDMFNCIICEKLLNSNIKISIGEYIYVIAQGIIQNGKLYIICKEIYNIS